VSKTVETIVQNTLESNEITGAHLIRFDFGVVTTEYPDGIYRVTDASQDIYWDEEGAGEKLYEGVGGLLQIAPLSESSELGALQFQLVLGGIEPERLALALTENYSGRPIFIYYATIDPETIAVQGGQTGPILMTAALMDHMNIEFGELATITVNLTSRLADWERARGGRYTNEHQQSYVDPNDRAFEYVVSLQRREVNWGGYTSSGGGGVSPGRRYRK